MEESRGAPTNSGKRVHLVQASQELEVLVQDFAERPALAAFGSLE